MDELSAATESEVKDARELLTVLDAVIDLVDEAEEEDRLLSTVELVVAREDASAL